VEDRLCATKQYRRRGLLIKGRKLAFIGSGFMGESLVRGLVMSKTVSPGNIVVSDTRRQAVESLVQKHKVKGASDNAEAVQGAEIIVLCVKPDCVGDVIKKLGPKLDGNKLIISVAAGVRLDSLVSCLPKGARIVRAMPNMAAMVGQSATAICAGGEADENDIATTRQIFDAVGKCVVVREPLMDAVTGLSGSGPAYVFMFLEALADAGVRCGLARDVASELAGQTLYGAALLAMETGEHPAKLKDLITSPGGTTIAGIASFEENGFRNAVIKAVGAATARSKELGK